MCPSDEGLRYTIDDQYSECGFDNLSQLYGTGHYSCVGGGTCPEDSACQIEFDQLIVNADPHFFPDCIESTVTDKNDVVKPVQEFEAPQAEPRDPGLYTARFQTEWSIILDGNCDEQQFSRRIYCTNGDIRIVNQTSPIACVSVDSGAIACSDVDGSNGSLEYVCLHKKLLYRTRMLHVDLIQTIRLSFKLQECTSEAKIPESKVEIIASKSEPEQLWTLCPP